MNLLRPLLTTCWLLAVLPLAVSPASAQSLLGQPYLGGAFQLVQPGLHLQAGVMGLIVPGLGVRGDATVTFGGDYLLGASALYHGTFLPGSPFEGYFGGGPRFGSVSAGGERRLRAGAGVIAGGAFSIGPTGVFGEAAADWLSAAGLVPSVRLGLRFYP